MSSGLINKDLQLFSTSVAGLLVLCSNSCCCFFLWFTLERKVIQKILCHCLLLIDCCLQCSLLQDLKLLSNESLSFFYAVLFSTAQRLICQAGRYESLKWGLLHILGSNNILSYPCIEMNTKWKPLIRKRKGIRVEISKFHPLIT